MLDFNLNVLSISYFSLGMSLFRFKWCYYLSFYITRLLCYYQDILSVSKTVSILFNQVAIMTWMWIYLFHFITVDTVPPQITGCPLDIHKAMELGTTQVQVSWDKPRATDNSGDATLLWSSHKSGESFDVGTTLVSYRFADSSNKTATCEFRIIITQGKILLLSH